MPTWSKDYTPDVIDRNILRRITQWGMQTLVIGFFVATILYDRHRAITMDVTNATAVTLNITHALRKADGKKTLPVGDISDDDITSAARGNWPMNIGTELNPKLVARTPWNGRIFAKVIQGASTRTVRILLASVPTRDCQPLADALREAGFESVVASCDATAGPIEASAAL